jgi:pectinesterase
MTSIPRFIARFVHAVVVAILPASVFAVESHTKAEVRVVLVGDSTVASGTGWGDAFSRLLSPGVKCVNLGRPGRSSKSFREEGHWKSAIEERPTWIFIQFGHNDQPGKGPKLETDAQTTFRDNLRRYIEEARAIGAKPVLVTSLTRRNFNAQGKIDPLKLEPFGDAANGTQAKDFLTDYVTAAKVVADETKVLLLDLNARSVEQMNQIGPKAAASYGPKSSDAAKPDRTHLSSKGAVETAKLVAGEIRKNDAALAQILKP